MFFPLGPGRAFHIFVYHKRLEAPMDSSREVEWVLSPQIHRPDLKLIARSEMKNLEN